MAIRRSVLALVVSFCLSHVVIVRAVTVSPHEMAILAEAGGLVSVEARINGAGPFRLMLDTGSSMSSVSRKLVRTLQLSPAATIEVLTPAANRERGVVRLDELSVGSASRRGLLASILEDRDLAAFGPDVDGIVGQNFLAELHYAIDYRRMRLVWSPDAVSETPSGATLPLKLEHGRWLAGLPQDAEGRVLWLVPDSGAAALVLFDRGLAPLLPVRHMSCCAGITTINGSGSARVVLVPEFKVGSRVIRNRRAFVINRMSAYAPAGDGLLPLSMFSSVSFQPDRQVLRVTF